MYTTIVHSDYETRNDMNYALRVEGAEALVE